VVKVGALHGNCQSRTCALIFAISPVSLLFSYIKIVIFSNRSRTGLILRIYGLAAEFSPLNPSFVAGMKDSRRHAEHPSCYIHNNYIMNRPIIVSYTRKTTEENIRYGTLEYVHRYRLTYYRIMRQTTLRLIARSALGAHAAAASRTHACGSTTSFASAAEACPNSNDYLLATHSTLS
jgi:hypothetical protein